MRSLPRLIILFALSIVLLISCSEVEFPQKYVFDSEEFESPQLFEVLTDGSINAIPLQGRFKGLVDSLEANENNIFKLLTDEEFPIISLELLDASTINSTILINGEQTDRIAEYTLDGDRITVDGEEFSSYTLQGNDLLILTDFSLCVKDLLPSFNINSKENEANESSESIVSRLLTQDCPTADTILHANYNFLFVRN